MCNLSHDKALNHLNLSDFEISNPYNVIIPEKGLVVNEERLPLLIQLDVIYPTRKELKKKKQPNFDVRVTTRVFFSEIFRPEFYTILSKK